MSDSKKLYRIEDAKQRKRLSEFESCEDPTDRRSEIASARMMLESAINSGNHSVANSLLTTLDRLQKNCLTNDCIRNNLLTKQAVHRFVSSLVAAMTEVIQKHFPDGWEDAMVEVSESIDECFDELRNDPKDVQSLKLPR